MLNECKIVVDAQTYRDFLAYCPFHTNTDTPALSISLTNGMWYCFSPHCGEKGTLQDLVMRTLGKNAFQALRMINKYAGDERSFAEVMHGQLNKRRGFIEIPMEDVDRFQDRFWETRVAIDYMHGRGFDDETLRHFKVGFAINKYSGMETIFVPMFDIKGMPIGWIGRGIHEKAFKNSSTLPVSQTLFNIHRAKRYDKVIVLESNFDVMTLWQMGHPNAVATLGGSFGPPKQEQLKRFDEVILMTDNDELRIDDPCAPCGTKMGNACRGHIPGYELGVRIKRALKDQYVTWAVYEDDRRLPGKDPGEMTTEQVNKALENLQSNWQDRRLVL